jgi:MoaA/NifB/PqqE/SkfB family radical SAM enzyme
MAIDTRRNIEWEEERYPRPLIKKRTLGMYISAAWIFLKHLISREIRYYRKRPIDTLFFLTYRCTSRCKTCTLWQRTDKSGEMDLDEWKRAVDQCAELGAKNFELFGGDALIRKDILIPLTQYISSKPGLCSDLVTNCNLMTEKTARGLVEAGLHDLWISIDGVAEDHNAVRGRDKTFSKVEQTIQWMLEARGDSCLPLLHANTTISNLNYDTFDRVLPYADEMGMDFHHLEYAGEFWDELLDESTIDNIKPEPYFIRQEGKSILAGEEQARIIKDKVAQMKKDARRMRISLQCENVDKLSTAQMVSGDCDNRRCYITRTKISVDPRGNILGCSFFGNWILGNIREKPLKEIWNNQSHKKFMKHFAGGDMKLCDYCILGVQRNPSPAQNIRDYINRARGKARM